MVELARRAERSSLTNGNDPQGRKLSEAARSDMEAFLEQLQIVLPVLGVNVLRGRESGTPLGAEAVSPVFTLTNTKLGVDARAQVIDGEFVVLKESALVPEWKGVGKAERTRRAYDALRALHKKLVADGSISVVDGVGRLTRDVAFSSPSQAGAVAMGRSCNGRLEWKWPGGGTYGDWENRGVEAAAARTALA